MATTSQLGPRRQVEKGKRLGAQRYEAYLEKKMVKGMHPHIEATDHNWHKEFVATARIHNNETNNVAIEYVQSWSPDESQKVDWKRLQEVGVDAVREVYPGHEFIVYPHVNKNGCYHNHLIINCVNSESGKRIRSTFKERHKMNQITDRLCQELGLSIPDRSLPAKERLAKSVRKIEKSSTKIPYQLQIMKKADIARWYSTSFGEFVETMQVLGIEVNVKPETITYHHPARQTGVRDRSIGTNYSKEGLSEQFAKNKKEYARRPQLRAEILGTIESITDERGNILGDTSSLPLPSGGARKFEKERKKKLQEAHYDGASPNSPESHLYADGSLLNSFIRDVKSKSIPEYCKENGITLTPLKGGGFQLKGREHIHIKDNVWTNTRPNSNGRPTGTTGNLLEFVANHKNFSVIEALSEVSGNKRIMLLEKYLGAPQTKYKEFSVPKHKQVKETEAISALGKLARQLGYKSSLGRLLLKTKRAQVMTSGVIRFLHGSKNEGAIDYMPQENGEYKKKKMGKLREGILKQVGSDSELYIFRDPFAFSEATRGRHQMYFTKSKNFLVLGEGDEESVDHIIAQNPKIEKIKFIGLKTKELSKHQERLIQKGGLSVESLSIEEFGKSRGRGLEIKLW